MALTDGLIALWELEEASGTRNDSIGALDLDTLTGAPTSTTGVINDCVVLTSAQNLRNVGGAHPWAGIDDISFGCWFQVDALATLENVFVARANSLITLLITKLNSDEMQGRVRDDTGTIRTRTNAVTKITAINTWYHCLVTYARNGNLSTYMNANVNAVGVIDSPVYSSTVTPIVEVGLASLNGKVDQMAIWNRELSSAEATALYNGGSGVSLLRGAYWQTGVPRDLGQIGYTRSWA